MTGAVFLEGEKIDLRTIEEEDIEFLRDNINKPVIRKNIGHRGPTNFQQEEDFFEEVVSSDEGTHLAISNKENSDMIGIISLEPKSEGVAEIGIWIDPGHHSNGFGTEASELLINHGFNRERLHRIHARVLQTNEKSKSLWEKLGFTQEGTLREDYFDDGEFWDTEIYGLLEEEWNS